MLPPHFKIALFLFLWHEMAGHLRIGVDGAFFATLAVFYGTRIIRAFGVECCGMSRDLTAAFFFRGALWAILFCGLVPDMARSLPITIILAALAGLMMIGVHGRRRLEKSKERVGKAYLYVRSEAVAVGVMIALAAAFISQALWGSVLPLVGYVCLVALPVSFGWMAAAPDRDGKFDASFGDEEMFHDAGVSDDT